MARLDNFRASLRGITVTGVNKSLLAAQGALVMGIFVFFNTTYSVFGSNFATWGKYLIFPAFMATELLMAGIATYWHIKNRETLFSSANTLSTKEKLDELRLMDIRLSAIWIKTGLILLSGLAGLGVIPGAAAFSAPLMIAGLALYAMVALALDMHDIRRNATKNMIENKEKAFPSYTGQIYNKRLDLIGSFLLFTVVTCVMVANYIPELVFQIPGMSPVSVLMGVLAGAATMAMAYKMPGEPKKPQDSGPELKVFKSEQMKPENSYGPLVDPTLVNKRLAANNTNSDGSATSKPHTPGKNGTPHAERLTQAQIKDMSTEQQRIALFGNP